MKTDQERLEEEIRYQAGQQMSIHSLMASKINKMVEEYVKERLSKIIETNKGEIDRMIFNRIKQLVEEEIMSVRVDKNRDVGISFGCDC